MSTLDGKGEKPIVHTSFEDKTQRQEPKEISQSDLIKILATEGAAVVPQLSYNIPTTVNYYGLEANTAEHIVRLRRITDDCARACQHYLEGSLITDSFGNNHSARTNWRKTMGNKYGNEVLQMLYNNKLRINMITSVRNSIGTLANFLIAFGAPSSKATAIKELSNEFPDCSLYEQLTEERKLEIVRKTESACKSFLEIIAKE